jgi:membrane protease YdiL (CAAX protease family)
MASIFVAAAWLAWHVPGYLLTDKSSADPFLPFAVISLPFSIVFTWIYYRSRQSLLLPILLHGSINASFYSLVALSPPVTASTGFQPAFDWVLAILWSVAAIILLTFSKGRLIGANFLSARDLKIPKN